MLSYNGAKNQFVHSPALGVIACPTHHWAGCVALCYVCFSEKPKLSNVRWSRYMDGWPTTNNQQPTTNNQQQQQPTTITKITSYFLCKNVTCEIVGYMWNLSYEMHMWNTWALNFILWFWNFPSESHVEVYRVWIRMYSHEIVSLWFSHEKLILIIIIISLFLTIYE